MADKPQQACFLDDYTINAGAFAHAAPLERIVGEVVRLVLMEIVSRAGQ